MATLVLETPEGVDLYRDIAGPGSRSAAALLDLLAFLAVYLTLLLLVLLLFEQQGLSGVVIGLLSGGALLFLCAYPAVCGILFEGRTLGKFLMGLRVVGDEGYPAEPAQHILRSLLWPLELALWIPVPLGLILIATTERRQRLGDMIAGTIVVQEESAARESEPFRGETWSGLKVRTLELSATRVADLDRRDFELLRSLLMRRGLEREAQRKLFVRTARHFDERLGLGGFRDARVFLKELYLFLRERRRR